MQNLGSVVGLEQAQDVYSHTCIISSQPHIYVNISLFSVHIFILHNYTCEFIILII